MFIADPTREEMLAFLANEVPEADMFDVEEALYWFASDWHGGQSSNLYAALCASPFEPSHMSDGASSGLAAHLYDALEAHFTSLNRSIGEV